MFTKRSILTTTDKTVVVKKLIVKINKKNKQEIPNYRVGKSYLENDKKMKLSQFKTKILRFYYINLRAQG